MTDLLSKENVKIVDSVLSAKEAINVAIEPLVKGGFCEERYIDEINKNMEAFGAYFAFSEDLALLHARSDQGAIKTQLSLVKLNNPFCFSDNGISVHLLIGLVAKDSFNHMKIIKAIGSIFDNHDNVTKLNGCKTEEELFNTFNELLKKA